MSTLSSLADRMEKAARELPERVNKITVKMIEDLLFELVTVTPVDTSKALSNWQVKVGAPVTREIEAYYEGEGGDTQPESAQAAHEAGRSILITRKQGKPVYLSNLADYIRSLNHGSSAQAPAGFVEMAIDRVSARIGDSKIKLV